MLKRWISVWGLLMLLISAAWAGAAQEENANTFMKKLSDQVLQAVRTDKAIQNGDTTRINQLIDQLIVSHVNMERMTASTVGRYWRQATPQQQRRLQEEFKTLLMRTYAGALTKVKDQTIRYKPLRASPSDQEVVVRSEVLGKGEPVRLDYRLEKTSNGWKIYDVNILGVWLVENYRNSFAQEISAGGIDGLIIKLAQRNKNNVNAAAAKD